MYRLIGAKVSEVSSPDMCARLNEFSAPNPPVTKLVLG